MENQYPAQTQTLIDVGGFGKLLVAVQSRKFGSRSSDIELQNYGIFRKIICLFAREEQNKQRQNPNIFHINHIVNFRKTTAAKLQFFCISKRNEAT